MVHLYVENISSRSVTDLKQNCTNVTNESRRNGNKASDRDLNARANVEARSMCLGRDTTGKLFYVRYIRRPVVSFRKFASSLASFRSRGTDVRRIDEATPRRAPPECRECWRIISACSANLSPSSFLSLSSRRNGTLLLSLCVS